MFACPQSYQVDQKPQAASITQAPSRLGMRQIFCLVVVVSAVVQIGIARMSWDKFSGLCRHFLDARLLTYPSEFIVYASEYRKIAED
jgi:hypothetical protein